MNLSNFQKSDMSVQAAWKGFSSQTFYAAARLISVDDECIDGVNAFKIALLKRIKFWQKELVSYEILVQKLMRKQSDKL